MLERVIEEQARGDASKADAIRAMITDLIGTDLSKIVPGSDAAMRLKAHLIEQGAWSQYLEVGIGKDAEVFTKCPPMATVGTGSEIGVLSDSHWNNPEPELVLAISARGQIVGASLGNDVNLRDVEGRSALLLGKAKDNNASCAIGPFIRLLDASLGLDQLRATTIRMSVRGEDGFTLSGTNSVAAISRDITDLAAQTLSSEPPVPGRRAAVHRHDVRADPGSRPSGPGLHAQGGRPGGDRLSRTRHADQPREPLRPDRALDVRHGRTDAQPRAPTPAVRRPRAAPRAEPQIARPGAARWR